MFLQHNNNNNSHHDVVFLTTGPQLLPKPVLHTVWSIASSFNFQYLLFSLNSSTSCLRILPRLLLPSNFNSVRYFRRKFFFSQNVTNRCILPSFYCTYDAPFLIHSLVKHLWEVLRVISYHSGAACCCPT